ncbi:MAG: hypothetical protein ACI9OJ_001037 [Myxococcota bacterium]|jgi:hypothetical protein
MTPTHRFAVFFAVAGFALSQPADALADKPGQAKFKIKPDFLIQTRMTYLSQRNDTTVGLPRARFGLEGKLKGMLEAELSLGFDDFALELKDAYADVFAYGHALRVKVGHFKRPFSRERLTSGARIGGVERMLIRGEFDQGRDLGVMLHNGLTDRDGFEWAFGVFTDFDLDEFDPAVGELGVRPTLALRLGYNTKGLEGYRETDEDRGPFRFGVGASGLVFLETSDSAPGRRGYRWNVDAIAKVRGVTAAAALFGRIRELSGGHDALGAYAHVAYRLASLEELEVALRYGGLLPDSGTKEHEATLGINTYFFSDHLMVKADGGVLVGDGGNDYRFRLQVQVR